MEEDQQDSGGEYDLQEGFDRLMIFCGENQTESLEFCKLHCEFTGWFSYVFLPIFSTNMKTSCNELELYFQDFLICHVEEQIGTDREFEKKKHVDFAWAGVFIWALEMGRKS